LFIKKVLFVYNKYSYFQKSCINIIENANTKHVAVLTVTDSPRKRYVIKVKIMIPDTNDKNLPGQNSPPNPVTANRVASIKRYVIGMPQSINAQRHSFAHGHIIGPLTCIQTIDCPKVNMIADIAINLRFIIIIYENYMKFQII
jgi:hypothetical protein